VQQTRDWWLDLNSVNALVVMSSSKSMYESADFDWLFETSTAAGDQVAKPLVPKENGSPQLMAASRL